MPFANREVAVIVANELNRHDRGLWFYEVERHIDDKRWIIARKGCVLRADCARSSSGSYVRHPARCRRSSNWRTPPNSVVAVRADSLRQRVVEAREEAAEVVGHGVGERGGDVGVRPIVRLAVVGLAGLRGHEHRRHPARPRNDEVLRHVLEHRRPHRVDSVAAEEGVVGGLGVCRRNPASRLVMREYRPQMTAVSSDQRLRGLGIESSRQENRKLEIAVGGDERLFCGFLVTMRKVAHHGRRP